MASRNDDTVAFLGLGIMLAVAMAWITHVVVCFKTGSWGFLIAGAIFFPIGIIHGFGCWVGMW